MADGRTRILVTGAAGELGAELTLALRRRHGGENVVAVAQAPRLSERVRQSGPFETCDVRDGSRLGLLLERHRIGTVFHTAATSRERSPEVPRDADLGGLPTLLDAAREHGLVRVFISDYAAAGPAGDAAPNTETTRGCTDLAEHHARDLGLDVRGLRFPAVLSSTTSAADGAAAYVVEILCAADTSGHYPCPLPEDALLPMIYLPDCVRAALALMDAPRSSLTHPVWYDVEGLRPSVGDLVREIRRHLPGLVCSFVPDGRRAVAASWAETPDDEPARADWNWQPEYGLERVVADLIAHLVGTSSPIGQQT